MSKGPEPAEDVRRFITVAACLIREVSSELRARYR